MEASELWLELQIKREWGLYSLDQSYWAAPHWYIDTPSRSKIPLSRNLSLSVYLNPSPGLSLWVSWPELILLNRSAHILFYFGLIQQPADETTLLKVIKW